MWLNIIPVLMCITLFLGIMVILHEYQYLNNASFYSSLVIKKYALTGRKSQYKLKQRNFTESVLELTRQSINVETWDYNFSHSGVNSIDDLVMASGGEPVRSVIISTWRSGSSFLGDLLNSVPGTFYNYEPLMLYGPRQIREPPLETSATHILKKMLQCNFVQALNGNKEYFTFLKSIRKVVNQIVVNKRLWRMCTSNENLLCYNAEFVSKMCELFPFQTMKLVRYRLPLATHLLDDKDLNVRLVLLVRDPRAVMSSRKGFCSNLDCWDLSHVCSDMVNDHRAAASFIHRYPDSFMALRYEDLVSDLGGTTRRLLKFLRLSRTQSVAKFLQTHTNVSDNKRFSTFRVSRKIPYKWKTALNFTRVQEIQEACREAMSVWGYEPAHNASHLASKTFHPVRPWSMSQPAEA